MSCHSVCRAFLIAIFGTLAIAAHAVPSYTILDLGTLAGPTSRGYGVNDKGQVTGVTGAVYDPFIGGYFQHAFIWDKTSGMTDLGTITGSWSSQGNAINDNGQVTGQSWVVYPFSMHAFVWDASSGMSSLGTLEGGADMELSSGFGINNSGAVTGRSTTTDGPDHAFLWDAASGMIDLGSVGLGSGYSSGNGINDSGVVTGSYSVSGPLWDVSHAYVWDAVNGVTDIGTLGGLGSVGVAINDIGQVAGNYSLFVPDPAHPGPIHAFTWDAASGTTDLGTLGGADASSYADAINDAARVVGWSEIEADLENRAFLWDPIDGMLNLQDLVADFSDWEYLERATDISNTGYITGYGYNAEGLRRAFLMVPSVNGVPTSSPISLIALGLTCFGFRAFRAKQL